jgi:hypothetical protein
MAIDAWFANGQNQRVGLQAMKMEGTTYDHMTWAFAYFAGVIQLHAGLW